VPQFVNTKKKNALTIMYLQWNSC